MKFAQFQSTYKSIPTQVYEQTGKELEAKYYENRQQSSLLRQGLSNAKVEDRNIGHLAKATTDVENMLDQVDGKWHYASNTLYNAKDRITGDKALNASMEDYAKAQATKADVQKQFEEGKIDQEALNAFYTNDKRYNNKAIELDENGQATNRWATPTPPPKVDTTKKILEINTLLLQHKNDIIAGRTGEGTPVFALYSANPALKGYVDKETFSGVNEQTLANAAKNWIDSTPEVKQYYNYINDAKVFNAVTERDSTGKYMQDESGNFIQKDLTPKDFRDLGIPLMDNWVSLRNSMIIPDIKTGILKTISINGLSPNFKDTPLYKQYVDAGFSDKEALQKIYSKTLTDLNTNEIVDFAKSFAYMQTDRQTIKDEDYWYKVKKRDDKEKETNIFGGLPGTAPLVAMPQYNTAAVTKTIDELTKRMAGATEGTVEYNEYRNRLNNIRATNKVIRDAYLESGEGQELTNRKFDSFLFSIPKEDRKLFNENKQKVIDYMSGKTSTLGFTYDTSKKSGFTGNWNIDSGSIANLQSRDISLQDRLNGVRKDFDEGLTDHMQKGGLNLNIKTIDFTDKQGGISKVSEELGNFLIDRGDSFNNLNALDEQGQSTTLDDYYGSGKNSKGKDKIDSSRYKAVAQFTDHYGKFVVKFIPRKEGIDPLKDDKRIVIEPNAQNTQELMNEMANTVERNTDGNSDIVNNWVRQTRSNNIFGNIIEPIYDALAVAQSQGIPSNKFGDMWLSNVPLSVKEPTKMGDFKITFNQDNSINIYQSDKNHTISNLLNTVNSIDEVQEYLLGEFIR